MRSDGRSPNQLRPVQIEIGNHLYAEGAVRISVGNTQVICTASIEEKVPPFMKGQGKGWVTAEYSMLPRATLVRNQRESIKGKQNGRTMEIQRLIGRALRSVVDLEKLGERTITLDCDVIQADGGTRTTSITGAFVALVLAVEKYRDLGLIRKWPIKDWLASTSVGILDGDVKLDLNYEEDSSADVDCNVVMTASGLFVEIQGTAEDAPFSREQMNVMLSLAEDGIRRLIEKQREAIGTISRFFDHKQN